METRQTLKRPKRRLCFSTNKDRVPSQWTEPLTLEDVEKMFDDIDSVPHEDSLMPSPAVTQSSDSEIQHSVKTSPAEQVEHQAKRCPPSEKVFVGDDPFHATKTPISLVADSEMVIKLPGPVNTSSPIEEMGDAGGVEKYKNCKVVSPILLNCEVEAKDKAEMEPLNTQDSLMEEFDLPVSLITLKRPPVSTHKNNVDGPCKEGQLVKEGKRGKTKSKRQVSSDEPVGAVTQRPEPTQKQSSSDHSQAAVGKDLCAFLQKVREAAQARVVGKLQTPVKAPSPPLPPEPEEDFLILEEEPLLFTIPTKSIESTKKREKSRTRSSDSSADKGANDSPQEAAEKEMEPENTNAEHRVDPADLMTKSNTGQNDNNAKAESENEKNELTKAESGNENELTMAESGNDKNELTKAESGNEKNELTTPEDDAVEQGRPVKKKQKLKNISLKVSKKVEKEPKVVTKTDNETVSTNETNTAKTLKQAREVMQGAEDDMGTEIEEKSNDQKMETQAQEKPVLSDSSSLEENLILGKRKRKPVGQWWMSCSQNSEETRDPYTHLSPKKLKEQREEPGPSGAQTKTKDKVVKKGNRKRAKKGRQNLSHNSSKVNDADQVFHEVNRNTSDKGTVRTPSDRDAVNTSVSEAMEPAPAQPQHRKPIEPKSLKDRRKRLKQKQQHQSPGPGSLRKGLMSTPKTVKRSLATFKDIFLLPMSETPAVGSHRDAGSRCGAAAGPLQVSVFDQVTLDHSRGAHSEEAEVRSAQDSAPVPDCRSQSENTAKDLRSGPSSMIQVQENENSCDPIPPFSSVAAALTASDLCGPPLKPLNLQPKDKSSLKEWFRSLWSSSDNKGTKVSPDHFKWFFHQGRVCGLQVDLNCGSICNGKMLLGSYMKKPLWVDHSATTVFNVLTSSVDVIIDGRKSHYSPGQAFMVQCGHAYSIGNLTAQPAVLYFTRILSESSD